MTRRSQAIWATKPRRGLLACLVIGGGLVVVCSWGPAELETGQAAVREGPIQGGTIVLSDLNSTTLECLREVVVKDAGSLLSGSVGHSFTYPGRALEVRATAGRWGAGAVSVPIMDDSLLDVEALLKSGIEGDRGMNVVSVGVCPVADGEGAPLGAMVFCACLPPPSESRGPRFLWIFLPSNLRRFSEVEGHNRVPFSSEGDCVDLLEGGLMRHVLGAMESASMRGDEAAQVSEFALGFARLGVTTIDGVPFGAWRSLWKGSAGEEVFGGAVILGSGSGVVASIDGDRLQPRIALGAALGAGETRAFHFSTMGSLIRESIWAERGLFRLKVEWGDAAVPTLIAARLPVAWELPISHVKGWGARMAFREDGGRIIVESVAVESP